MAEGDLKARIRRARGKFVAMAATYGFGTFNDSFFRNSAMLLAVGWGQSSMQGYILAVFTLPYILFASPAGWLADRFAKRRVVIAAKALEFSVILVGAAGIFTGSWPCIIAMVFALGAQACLFSPALNGSIPELYPAEFVTEANARLKVVTTIAILAGISVSGFVLNVKHPLLFGLPAGQAMVAGGIVIVSTLGLLASLWVPSRPAAAPGKKFPWTGPVDTVRECARIDKDRLLAVVSIADVAIWSIGSLMIPLINVMAMGQFGRGEKVAGILTAMEVVGVAVGGLVGSRLAKGPRWHRVLPAGMLFTGVFLLSAGAVPLVSPQAGLHVMFVLMALVGIAGGAVLVPCEAFVQTRASDDRKGAVIASVNFATFCGILVSGLVASVLTGLVDPSMTRLAEASWARFLVPTSALALIGLVALGMSFWLWKALRREEAP